MTEAATETETIEETIEELTEATIEVEQVTLTFTIKVTGVETLGEAVDVAALSIARNGLNSFHILAKDDESDQSWIVYGGQVADTSVSSAASIAAILDEEERMDEEEERESLSEDEDPEAKS